MSTKLHAESACVFALWRMYRSQSPLSTRPRSRRKKRRTSSYMDRARDALTAADASEIGSISTPDCCEGILPESKSSSSSDKSVSKLFRIVSGSSSGNVDAASSPSISAPCSSNSVNAWSLSSSTSNPHSSVSASDSNASTRSRSLSSEMKCSSTPDRSRSAANVFAQCSLSRGDRPGKESGSSAAAASHRSGRADEWSGPVNKTRRQWSNCPYGNLNKLTVTVVPVR